MTSESTQTIYRSYIIEEYHLTTEPYYVPVADEVELFEAAYHQKIPLIFKGPTGCGKTRFVEYMSYKLGKNLTKVKQSEDSEDALGVQPSAFLSADDKNMAVFEDQTAVLAIRPDLDFILGEKGKLEASTN